MDEIVGRYLDFALKPKGIARHHLLRQIFALSREISPEVFLRVIERALRYRIAAMPTLRRIALLLLDAPERALPAVDIDESFRTRESYLEGRLSDAPDFSRYNRILEENNDE